MAAERALDGNPHVRFDVGDVVSACSKHSMLLAACCAALAASADVTADFTQTAAKFRPALHSSGFAPTFNRRHDSHWDEQLKEMNFE